VGVLWDLLKVPHNLVIDRLILRGKFGLLLCDLHVLHGLERELEPALSTEVHGRTVHRVAPRALFGLQAFRRLLRA